MREVLGVAINEEIDASAFTIASLIKMCVVPIKNMGLILSFEVVHIRLVFCGWSGECWMEFVVYHQ